MVLLRPPPQLPLPAHGWVSRRRLLGATGAAAVLCHIVSGPARPSPRLPFAAAELTVSPGVARRGGSACGRRWAWGAEAAVPWRAGTFLSREELAPGAGVFPARGSGGAWAPGVWNRGEHGLVRSLSGGNDRPEGASRSRSHSGQRTAGRARRKPTTGELL